MKIRKAKCKGGGISVQGRRISIRAMAALRACLDIYDTGISWGDIIAVPFPYVHYSTP